MRFYLFFLIFLLYIIPTNAWVGQNLEMSSKTSKSHSKTNLPEEKESNIFMDIRIGTTFVHSSDLTTSFQTGYTFGFGFIYSFNSIIGLNSGLTYTQNRFGMNSISDLNITIHQLSLPLLCKIGYQVGDYYPYISFGPQVSYNARSIIDIEGGNTYKGQSTLNFSNQLNPISYGPLFEIGVDWLTRMGKLSFSISYTYEMNKVIKKETFNFEKEARINHVAFNLGYQFDISPLFESDPEPVKKIKPRPKKKIKKIKKVKPKIEERLDPRFPARIQAVVLPYRYVLDRDKYSMNSENKDYVSFKFSNLDKEVVTKALYYVSDEDDNVVYSKELNLENDIFKWNGNISKGQKLKELTRYKIFSIVYYKNKKIIHKTNLIKFRTSIRIHEIAGGKGREFYYSAHLKFNEKENNVFSFDRKNQELLRELIMILEVIENENKKFIKMQLGIVLPKDPSEKQLSKANDKALYIKEFIEKEIEFERNTFAGAIKFPGAYPPLAKKFSKNRNVLEIFISFDE